MSLLVMYACVQARDEFQSSSNDLTINKLIDTLVQSKTTGTEKPGMYHAVTH